MKSLINNLCLMLAVVFACGCGLYQLKLRTNPDKTAMNALTTLNMFEKDLATKYKSEIYDLFAQMSPGTSYDKGIAPGRGRYSIGFFTPSHAIAISPLVPADPIYFGSVIVTGSIYNRNKTAFAERASTVFVNNAKTYLSAAFSASGAAMQKDVQIKGVCVYLIWGLSDKIDDFSSLTATYSEALRVAADWGQVKLFIDNQISVQEFADKAIVTGIYNNNELGKVKIDTQKLL